MARTQEARAGPADRRRVRVAPTHRARFNMYALIKFDGYLRALKKFSHTHMLARIFFLPSRWNEG